MQRNQSALFELRVADHQAIWRDVGVSQSNGLRDAKPCTRQQREQRAVGLPSQSSVARLGSQLDELADLLVGEDVRSRPRPTCTAEDLGWDFVTCIFGTQISSQPLDVSQPAGPLMNRRNFCCPIDGRLTIDPTLAQAIRRRCEASQVEARDSEVEASGSSL